LTEGNQLLGWGISAAWLGEISCLTEGNQLLGWWKSDVWV